MAIRPGSTVFTVIPSPARSRASVLNAASRPERWALESISTGIGSRTALDDTFTIRPKPRSFMPGTTRSISAIGASTRSR